ncbi:hypothetical protein [Oleiharenicola sp. Vm1]|uniref:hypothetical protein n=1 Tax=Oleiharenicola sp. Vm1 TaxID=3398393 RepID=UPI0039F4C626
MSAVPLKNRLLLGAAAVVLLAAAVSAIGEIARGDLPRRLSPPLEERIPRQVGSVEGEDVPLGPNEFVDATAKEKMEYDDVLNRAYHTSRGVFSVYVGYWARGKRSPSHVASHTPDRCWTLAGMQCEQADHDFALHCGHGLTVVGQGRRFRDSQGQVLYTAFWHRVGDRFYDYGGTLGDKPSPSVRVKHVIRDLFVWREDQFFVRITASRPLVDFESDPTFQAVMESVANVAGLMPASAK